MKNILLLVHDDPGQESRLQVALDVTRAVGGHLECLEVRDLPMLALGNYAGGAEALALAEVERAQRALRVAIEQRLGGEDVPWSFGQSFDRPVDALSRGADLADLIVLSARLADEDTDGGDASPQPLPLRSGRPLLAVPPAVRGLALDKPALVAWDGSGPSIEAVRAAVPLLRHAAGVVVLEVDPPSGVMPMEDIATYLSRHGIVPELVERRSDDTIAAVLRDHVRAIDAGMLVMGAYGAGKLAQSIFGGVTRTMLSTSTVPLLLAH
ncbi:universal stress protein [Erythrobacter sp. sf7]|uniref:Universal stress protein n=1 Tax=Erythrobacter fulvus TaxID=2987523 RepID=A0ABT5JMJ5_9SPHN|nr:universal stress protein [Erythrobacter fulvus]MDC8753980.1 universal stress protein [Erythrobacter fulvus]